MYICTTYVYMYHICIYVPHMYICTTYVYMYNENPFLNIEVMRLSYFNEAFHYTLRIAMKNFSI